MTWFDIELSLSLPEYQLELVLRTDQRSVGLFGPSGAGKTTLLEQVAGWRHDARGHVRLGGRTLFDSDARLDVPARERGIGYVPQDLLLFPHWSARQNLLAGAERAAPGARIGFDDVVAVLELGELLERPVRALSGGEQHRVALGRALCSQPALLLLDEPLSGLELRLRRRILEDLVRVREEFHLPMLYISHDATEVQVLCDHVLRLERGRVIEEGAPDEVLARSAEAQFENILRGEVRALGEHTAHVQLASGHELVVPGLDVRAGDALVLGLRADDLLLAIEPPRGLSARNLLPGRVDSIRTTPGPVEVLVELAGADTHSTQLCVHLTADACRELALAPGIEVTLILKTNAVAVLTRVHRH